MCIRDSNQLGVSNDAAPGVVPDSVKIAFAIGAFVFLASVLYTVFTTKEYPPEDMQAFAEEKNQGNALADILHNIVNMPKQMLRIGFVQFFSWFAFFTMWSLATPALTEHVFKAPAPDPSAFNMHIAAQADAFQSANSAFQNAADLVGSYMGFYGLSSMLIALLLSFYASRYVLNRKLVHSVCLLAGGIGFLSMYYITEPKQLMLSFALVGVSWASILSMPYALLSSSVDPKKMGIMMGLFNMFIVIPQIVAALGGVNASYTLIGPAPINAMTVAGISLIIGSLLVFFIKETATHARSEHGH
jgi:maltose/moltooligosaccharide transporter